MESFSFCIAELSIFSEEAKCGHEESVPVLSTHCALHIFAGTVCIKDCVVCSRLHADEAGGPRTQMVTELWSHCTHVEGRVYHQEVGSTNDTIMKMNVF